MLQNIDTKKLKLLAQASKGIAQTCCEQERSGLRYSNENLSLLWRCAQDWDAMLYLRKEHARNLRYKNGDQWCDKVPDPENPGKMIREDALISRSGKIPLKHNYLQQYIRNIHGQLLSSPTQTVVYARSKDDQPLGEMLTNALQSCHQLNKVRKLDINVVEELCLTGLACAKVRFDYWSTKNRTDGKIDLVNINRLFFNKDIEDPRLNDIRRIGEIHDYTFDDLVRNFTINREDVQALREIYGVCHDPAKLESIYMQTAERLQNLNFLFCNDLGKYRVIEVWERVRTLGALRPRLRRRHRGSLHRPYYARGRSDQQPTARTGHGGRARSRSGETGLCAGAIRILLAREIPYPEWTLYQRNGNALHA
jgi:hypothetical protein